jgi:trypsin
VGGSAIAIDGAPWQVAVLAEVSGGEILCGGSIIGSEEVLTAAHCVFDPTTHAQLAPGAFFVIAGTGDITTEGLEHAPDVEARTVSASRPHPYYVPGAALPNPDDVAVLQLSEPLSLHAGAVEAIALPNAGTGPVEGSAVRLTGFGEQSVSPAELNGRLYSLEMDVAFSRQCGGEADAVFVCAATPVGSVCSGDSGGGLTEGSASPTLVGVTDTVEVIDGIPCTDGAFGGFANISAPEVGDFIDGSELPPHAPRGGGISISGVPTPGGTLQCESGTWSGAPTFSYAFIDSREARLLQSGGSSSYALSSADVGRTILCEVRAANAGGVGLARTLPMPAVEGRAEPIGSITGVLPGAIEPLPVDPRIEAEFWANPPWAHETPTVTTAHRPSTPTAKLTLAGTRVSVRNRTTALVKLRCTGTAACRGRLTIAAGQKHAAKGKGGRATQIAAARFTIAAGQTEPVRATLTETGRRMLAGDGGRLAARLVLTQTGPGSTRVRLEDVRLIGA